ncbi:hypothetical protein AGMMS50262_20720 [Bacteroidia bacterium]|nr:hypothetical protein AGMMS50262_20720 [Bacteroidia bacterium]
MSSKFLGTDEQQWKDVVTDLGNGSGGELKNQRGGNPPKFAALHSSAAICVNTFYPIRFDPKKFIFEKWNNFCKARFEEKMPTGISMPNLDFVLENDKVIIGFESKFTEYFEAKLEHSNENLQKYFDREELNYLSNGFMSMILYYLTRSERMHLNVAQLIKHTIGLLNYSREHNNKTPILVYIYWLPNNWEQLDEKEKQIFVQHKKEIDKFSEMTNRFIKFKAISYLDFWEQYKNENNSFAKHISDVVEKRYKFSL